MRSIRSKLLVWLLIGLTSATAIAAGTVYLRTRAEARDLFDYQLQLLAASFPDEGFGSTIPPPAGEADTRELVVVQIWDKNGALRYLSRPQLAAPHSVEPGFSTVSTPTGDWRIFSTIVGSNVVQISEPTGVREQLAASLAFRTILPLLILLPVLIVVILVTVSRGLKPLDKVALAVGERSAGALDPLHDHGVPTEVKPLVAALNDLLARLGRSLNLQRSFIADAAHELRTPLTAVRLQLQLAERAKSADERVIAFGQLKGGIDRASHLVDQLLALARSEPDAAVQSPAKLDLADVVKTVISERASIAESKSIDLGLSAERPLQIMGETDSLHTMIGNLVDNAIHFTPRGGRIDVEIQTQEGQACVVVTDTGPGIPVEERERVFDRFYRRGIAGEPGTGLGLAIVRAIALRHHAGVELATGTDSKGLKVKVCFPAE